MPVLPNLYAATNPFGESLERLVTSLYSGDGEARKAEREAKLEERRQNAAYKAAQIAKLSAEQKAREAAEQARANAPAAISEAFFPGQGQAVLDYRKAGGVVQPQPETSEMPGIMGGYDMPRPPGYTPQAEERHNRVLGGLAVSQALPGKTKYDDLMKGAGAQQEQDLIAEVLAGLRPRDEVAGARRAVRGEPLYQDHQGRVLDVTSGSLNEGGAQAKGNVAKTAAQAGQARAAAGAHTAHAGLYGAQTDYTRGKTDLLGGMAEVEDPDNPGLFFEVPEVKVGQHILDVTRDQSKPVKPTPLPSGWERDPDNPEALRAIPGGPADVKATGVFNQDTASLESTSANLDALKYETQKLLDHAGLPGITGIRGVLPSIPGGAAADAQAILNTLKAKVSIDTLQNMRANSKTGGALGNVSDAEGKRLESYLAALDKPQSLKQYKASLKQIIDFADGSKARLQNAYNVRHGARVRQQGGTPTAPSAPTAPPSAPTGPMSFASEAEANAAAASGILKPGMRVIVGGVAGTWQ